MGESHFKGWRGIAPALALFAAAVGCGDVPTGISVTPLAEPRSARGLVYSSLSQKDSRGRPVLLYYDLASRSTESLDLPAGVDGTASVSPDGARMAFTWAPEASGAGSGDDLDLGVYDFGTRSFGTLASAPGAYWHPAWSPLGEEIAVLYAPNPDIQGLGAGQFDVRIMTVDGTIQRTLQPDPYRYPVRWSPNGEWLLFGAYPIWDKYGGFRAIETTTRTTETIPFPTRIMECRRTNECAVVAPDWLPDGRVGFTVASRDADSAGIYTMVTDGSGVVRVVAGSYWSASWSSDGKYIAAQRADGMLSTLIVLNQDAEVVAVIGSDAEVIAWR